MSNNYVTGTANWAKVLGNPVPNFSKDGHEWTIDVSLDKVGIKTLKDLGIGDRIKNKGDDRGDFFQFKQKAERMDGTKNDPIRVVDARNRPWDQNAKIGNGSKVDVKFTVKDYGDGKRAGVYPQAIRVLDHKAYTTTDFAPLPEDNEYYAKAGDSPMDSPDFERDFGLLDDDVQM